MQSSKLILDDLVASLHQAALESVQAPSSSLGGVISKGEPSFGAVGNAINRCLSENGLPPADLPSHEAYWAERT